MLLLGQYHAVVTWYCGTSVVRSLKLLTCYDASRKRGFGILVCQTYYGTSVAKSLKLLTLPYCKQQALSTNITVTYLSSRYW